ncbi:SGNH/GDSL hydrolase family protein [Trichococcus alkaliphilus]|uniref:SGNH/GDSL hydrolase family protein n=1 Tax=Trichococcus alkaliphilus TaxID=2052943 RepID=UPI000D0BBF36|nr:SGNH/GDSL hydrolase family protein [Trichococcus alkaliphilus]
MKKKEIIIVSLMGILTIAIVLFGYKYAAGKKEALLSEGEKRTESVFQVTSSQESVVVESDTSEAYAQFLAAFSDSRSNATVVDYLQYVHYHKNAVNVAFFGDVASDAAWAKSAIADIQADFPLENLTTSFFSHPSDSSSVFLSSQYSQELVESNPDVIFYTIPTKTDQMVDISLAESTQSIYTVYDEIRAALPDALIVLVTPPPSEAKISDWNSRTLDYQNYTNNLISQNGAFTVPLYDVHSDFLAELANRSEALANFMDAAGVELNEAGQQLFGEMFANSLQTKMVDTTTGLYVEGEKPASTPIAPTLAVPEETVIDSEEAVSEEVDSEESVEEESAYEAPAYVAPTYVAPTYVAPTYVAPPYVAPVIEESVPSVDSSSSTSETLEQSITEDSAS